jgi:hypothetical protein
MKVYIIQFKVYCQVRNVQNCHVIQTKIPMLINVLCQMDISGHCFTGVGIQAARHFSQTFTNNLLTLGTTMEAGTGAQAQLLDVYLDILFQHHLLL